MPLRRFRSAAGSTLLVIAVAACASAPIPQRRRAGLGDASSSPTGSAPLLPARWIDASGATLVGPAVVGGRLVLLGGRRVVVGSDGLVHGESAPCPEPLVDLGEVPVSTGDRRLVARGAHGIYRFSDPLGAPVELAHSELELTALGTAPGAIAIWDVASDAPRLLDVETGRPKSLPGLPDVPLRAIAFRNDKEGAAIFHVSGLAVTSDGGASWRPVGESAAGDALRVTGLRLRDDAIRAFVFAEGRDARIDVAQGRVSAFEDASAAADEAALLRWVRVTGRDPLEAAASGGIDAPDGGAIIASHGLVARVDLRTSAIVDLSEFAHGAGMNGCVLARSARAAWIGCALSEDAHDKLYDPFGVLEVSLGGGRPVAQQPIVTRNGAAELRASPSGGLLLMGACDADEEGDACVRQPDGRWKTIKTGLDLLERGAGPLADGRVAFLRNLIDGDDAAEDKPAPKARGGTAKTRKPIVVAVDTSGKQQTIATVALAGPPASDLRAQSPVEEDTDHGLYFALADDEGAIAVTDQRGHDAPPPQRIPNAAQARLHAGRGVAIGEEHVLASLDAGASWSELTVPPRVRATLGHVLRSIDEPGSLAVSEVGLKIDTALRIGWGPAEPLRPDPPAPRGELLAPRTPPASRAPERVLACTAGEAVAGSAPPLASAKLIRGLLETKRGAHDGHKRQASTAFSGRAGLLDTMGLLEEEAPERDGAPPATWTLRWMDPTELGARVRQARATAPKGASWGASLRSVAAAGAHALFSVRAGNKTFVARVKSGGGVDVAEVSIDLVPGSDVVFAAEHGDLVAWLHDTTLVVWTASEAPRAIGSLAASTTRWLGQPTKDGVPVIVAGVDWSLLRVFSLAPAHDARAPAPDALHPSTVLSGWGRVNNPRRDLAQLAACGRAAKGTRVIISRPTAPLRVEGNEIAADSALYEVRIGTNDACVSRLTALINPERARGTAPKPAGPTNAVSFVRADFEAGRAEGGERSTGAPTKVRRLACTLNAR